MESKLNLNTITEYSEAFSTNILSQAYAHHEKLDGPGILNLTPIRQVNLFIINDLMNKWKAETQKLRSPYFDFEVEEVKEALEDFMNTLSQHIAIGKEQLEPLLKSATQNTLLLALDPAYFYHQVLNNTRHSLTVENVKELFRYVKLNRYYPEALLQHLDREKKDEVHPSYAIWLLNDKAEQIEQNQGDSQEIIEQFSQVSSISASRFYLNTGQQPAYSPPTPSYPEEEQHYSYEPEPEEEEPEEEKTYYEEKSDSDQEVFPKTLNDYLSKSEKTSLADIHEKRKIDSIRQNISVNQRFMFIRELFKNDAEEYNIALNTLEQQRTYAEAFNYLRKEFATKYRWRMDSEEVIEFLELISKRY